METPPKKSNAPVIVFYIFMVMGLIGLTVFLVDTMNIPEEMVMASFFALTGGLSFVALLRHRSTGWRVLTMILWILALFGFGVFLGERMNVHEGLVAAIILPTIGAMIYGLFTYYPNQPRAVPPTQYRALGDPADRIDPLQNPAERDVPVQRR